MKEYLLASAPASAFCDCLIKERWEEKREPTTTKEFVERPEPEATLWGGDREMGTKW